MKYIVLVLLLGGVGCTTMTVPKKQNRPPASRASSRQFNLDASYCPDVAHGRVKWMEPAQNSPK